MPREFANERFRSPRTACRFWHQAYGWRASVVFVEAIPICYVRGDFDRDYRRRDRRSSIGFLVGDDRRAPVPLLADK